MERSRFTYKGSFQAYQGKKVRAYATRRQNLIQQVRENGKKRCKPLPPEAEPSAAGNASHPQP